MIGTLLLAVYSTTSGGAVTRPQSSNAIQNGPRLDPATSALIQQGFDMLGRSDAAGAEAAFRKAEDAHPEFAIVHTGLALALWGEGKGNGAVREMTIASRLAPSDPDAHLEL